MLTQKTLIEDVLEIRARKTEILQRPTVSVAQRTTVVQKDKSTAKQVRYGRKINLTTEINL